MYKYQLKSSFRYDIKSGVWNYDNLNEWAIKFELQNREQTLAGDKLRIFIEKIPWDQLWGMLCKIGFNLNEKYEAHGFIDWAKAENKPLSVKRATAICLQHFSKSFKKKTSYTVVTSKVSQNLMVNIKDIPCWFFLHSKEDILAEDFPFYIITLPSLFFEKIEIGNNVNTGTKIELTKNIKENSNILKSYRLKQIHVITEIQKEDSSILVFINSDCEMVKYNKGLMCGCIPIPGREDTDKKGTEPKTIKTPEIVITSQNVVEALEYLSQIWQDKFAKSVLISAPPGSGKEQFSKTIAYGTGRLSSNEDINNHIISLADFIAEDRQEELANRLFGKKDKSKKLIKGLIATSAKKVLFLDEVHHPEDKAGIRASFLRTLESGRYEIKGDTTSKEVDDVLFVLATSKPFKSTNKTAGLNEIPPPDFWTRMTHVITIKHPFECILGESFHNTICHFFIFFWLERSEKYFKIDPETEENIDSDLKNTTNDIFIYTQRLAHLNILKEKSGVEAFSEIFYDRLILILREERIMPHQLSIRGFRNIVSRLFSISVERVMNGFAFEPDKLKEYIDPAIYEILEIATLNT